MSSVSESGQSVDVPDNEESELWRYAAGNRARLDILEGELRRNRDHIHELRGELAAVRYLGEKVGSLATSVDTLAGDLVTLSKRVVERPSRGTMAVFGQYLSLGVAVIALVIAAWR